MQKILLMQQPYILKPQPRAGIAIGDYVLEVARLVSVVPFEALNGKDSEQLFLKVSPTLRQLSLSVPPSRRPLRQSVAKANIE